MNSASHNRSLLVIDTADTDLYSTLKGHCDVMNVPIALEDAIGQMSVQLAKDVTDVVVNTNISSPNDILNELRLHVERLRALQSLIFQAPDPVEQQLYNQVQAIKDLCSQLPVWFTSKNLTVHKVVLVLNGIDDAHLTHSS